MKIRDEVAKFKSLYCGASHATAAGTGDNTAVTGATIDTQDYESAKIVISYLATLTDEKTYDLAVAYQESDDGSTWDTAVDLREDATVVTSDGGGAETGVLEYDVNLADKKRYFRVNFTPDLSHTGTDTAITSCVAIVTGSGEQPITNG